MKKNSNTLQHIGLLVLRLGFSGAMLTHGIPKLQKLMAGGEIKFADTFGIGEVPTLMLAIIGEVVAPLFIIIGFKTKWAAIPAAITMAVAFFIVHGKDAFGDKEMAFLYLIAFTALCFLGAGKFSLDGFLRRKHRN